MKNVMFREVPVVKPKSSAFDLSNEHTFSCKVGELIPIYWSEVVPGDKFRLRHEVAVKFAALLAPIFSRFDVFVHDFFVPFRLLMHADGTTYPSWDDFYAGDPEESWATDVLPWIQINDTTKSGFYEGTLSDYLGLPAITSGTINSQDEFDINLFPHMAYHLIYDHYYRPEDLQDRVTHDGYDVSRISLTGGPKTTYWALYLTNPRFVSFEKDYFRGALPVAYSGSESDVELDLTVYGSGSNAIAFSKTAGALPAAGATAMDGARHLEDSGSSDMYFHPGYEIGAEAVLEIMELRRAQSLTRFLEAENRGGKRAPEKILSMFGVISDDLRLSVPQYLGGMKQPVQVSSIKNVSQVLDPTAGVNDGAGGATVTVDPQALETGTAQAYGSSKRFNLYAKEFGLVMSMLFVRPRTKYKGGIEKFWHKIDDRTDFFNPYFQNIGDQEILNVELGYDSMTGVGNANLDVFGYAPRWAEYKFKNSTVSGNFGSDLDYWHNAYMHDTTGPLANGLSDTFVWVNPAKDEISRIYAVSYTDNLWVNTYNDVQAIRPMYVHDIPK
jgi:hypothetical protein